MAKIADPNVVDSGSPQKSRARTFSGCWTCRAKHVKCDEAQPTCNRCRRLKLHCEGYGVKISWTSVRSPSNFKSKSSKRKTGHIPTHGIITFCRRGSIHQRSTTRIQPAITDDSPFNEDTATVEEPSRPGAGISPQPVQDSPLEDDLITDDLCDQLFRSYGTLGQGFSRDISYPLSVSLSEGQIEPTGAQIDDNNTEKIDTPLQFDECDSSYTDTAWFPQPHSYPRNSKVASDWIPRNTNTVDTNAIIGLRHLDVVPDITLQCQLIEHWSNCVSDALNPVPGPHNIIRTAFIPIALEGARADSTTSTGATALFHLICSASAFHLSARGTHDPKRNLEKIALEHHHLGIVHLGQNINEPHNESQCISIIASLLMCILTEAVTVPTPFWYVHLRGAIEWVKKFNPQMWHQSESGSAVYQLFMGMAILAQSQFLSGDLDDAMWDLSPSMELQPDQYVLEAAYGVSRPTLQFIYEMNQLRIEWGLCRGQNPDSDAGISERLDALEVELFLSLPKRPQLTMGKELEDLIHHYGYIYYFGVLIYLKRTVRDRRLEEVQVLVEQSLPHIESLALCTNRPFCPGLWPIAIIAFEAERSVLQNRILNCLRTFADRSGLGVVTQLTILVQQLWTLRKEEGDLNLKWHDSGLPSMNSCFILF